jgi:hypothetical protein
LAQQQHAAVAAEIPAAKIGHPGARTEGRERERGLLTLCRRPGVGRCFSWIFDANNLSTFHARPFCSRMIFSAQLKSPGCDLM